MRLDDRLLLRIALVLGLVGAMCGILGDYFLTFTAAVPGGVPYQWDSVLELVREIPHERLAAGHYLGVFGMQLSVWGFFALLYGMRPAGRIWTIPPLFVVVFIYFVGCAYHGQLALLGSALQMAERAGVSAEASQLMIDEHKHLMWNQLTAVEIGIGFLSLWFPALVLIRPTIYPKWFAALSPFLVMGVFVGLAKLLAPEPVRMFVEMTVFNLVSFILIAVAAVFLWNQRPLPDPDAQISA